MRAALWDGPYRHEPRITALMRAALWDGPYYILLWSIWPLLLFIWPFI